MTWEATEKYPETRVVIDVGAKATDWKDIILISASDIALNFSLDVLENFYEYF